MVFFNLLLAVLASLMRFQIGGAPDGQGQATGDGSGGGTAPQTPPPATPPAPAPNNPDKTFSQSDVDRIVKERLDREKGKYADYDDLKAKAQKYDEAQSAEQSDLEKEKARADKAERDGAAAIERANGMLVVAAIKVASAGKNVRPEMVDTIVAALRGSEGIKVEADGSVTGADKVVEEFLKGKDYLLNKAAPGQSGAEFGGREQKTLDEQIAEAESKGDWRTANALKLQQMRSRS